MKSKVITALTIFALSLVIISSAAAQTKKQKTNKSDKKESKTMKLTNKEKVTQLLKSFETGETAPIAHINPDKYIQHNLAVGDGASAFSALLQQIPPKSAKIDVVRVFEDGDFVFAHTDYNLFGARIGFDIFRFENGLIVEHWDNLQEKPTAPNPGGHTMIDGATKVSDLDKTEVNKTLMRNFVDDILVNGRMEKFAGYFNGDNYIQHNPQIGDGLSGLGKAFEAMAKQGITVKYDRIHKVFAEGNFVLVVSEGAINGNATSFYDLFRVENGKIAEHWDTVETIPARENWKNQNGKFGF